MDKKKLTKTLSPDDLKGFEEFIDSQSDDVNFTIRPGVMAKKETTFEHFTFLTNDAERLRKIKNLLVTKLPFLNKFDQGDQLVAEQENEIEVLKAKLFEICETPGSTYRRSMSELFDAFFGPTQS